LLQTQTQRIKSKFEKTAQDMKEEFNKDMEKSQKKSQTEILKLKCSLNQTKNTAERHSSRVEQVEDRVSGLKDKTGIKEKNRRLLRQKTQEM
jgi:DNA anti-recombination protein RmuC